MDITISVSDRVIENIQEKANGKPIEDFVEEFVEESFANNAISEEGERPFMRMKGMFSSGRTDISSRIQELLNSEDFDPSEGFSVR
jgi:predicted Ser/Thr protein kinase